MFLLMQCTQTSRFNGVFVSICITLFFYCMVVNMTCVMNMVVNARRDFHHST